MVAFTWEAWPSRVVLGQGALPRVAEEVERLGGRRVLLVGGGDATRSARERVRAALGRRVAAETGGSAQPVSEAAVDAVAALAAAVHADTVVAVGGGSPIGLGKLVVLQREIPLVAIPTTYSGSEMTPIWGRTAGGRKQTGRDPRALPRAVVYDPELFTGMPPRLAAASGMNALAHCLEALWAPGANPVTTALALEGARRLLVGVRTVVATPDDVAAHAGNLVGACLAGVAVAQAGTGIHHRACHVLGGGWGLAHAETHAVLLPHTTALAMARAPELGPDLSALLGADDAGGRLHDAIAGLGLPVSLAALGMPHADLEEAATRLAAEAANGGWDRATVVRLLADAHAGRRPGPAPTPA